MLQGTGGRPLPWSSRSMSAGGCHQEGLFTRQLAIFSKAEAPAHFSWTDPYQGVCPELKVALGGLPNCRGNDGAAKIDGAFPCALVPFMRTVLAVWGHMTLCVGRAERNIGAALCSVCLCKSNNIAFITIQPAIECDKLQR